PMKSFLFDLSPLLPGAGQPGTGSRGLLGECHVSEKPPEVARWFSLGCPPSVATTYSPPHAWTARLNPGKFSGITVFTPARAGSTRHWKRWKIFHHIHPARVD